MAKKRAIKDLQPADFPGVDPIKFAKWRAAAAKYEPMAMAVYIAIAALIPLIYLVFRPLRDLPLISRVLVLGFVVFIALFVPAIVITRKPRQFAKDAGIDVDAIRDARRRPTAGSPIPSNAVPAPVERATAWPTTTAATAGSPMPVQAHPVQQSQVEVAEPITPPIGKTVCGKCGWRNSPENTRCDSCRSAL